jgi:predicted MFS family arabinose efflux permease
MGHGEPRGANARPRTRSLVTRHPQLLPVLVAEGASATGDAVFWVGLLVWLLEQPHGTRLLGLAAVARLGPRVVFGAAGGVLADHRDRRRLIASLDFVRAALMVVLFIVASGGSTTAVLLIVLATYTLATPYRPAVIAGIPLVVGETDAAPANALDGVIRQIATFLGPLLGVAVLWLGSPAWAFATNAVTFALSGVLFLRVHALAGPPPDARLRAVRGTGWSWDSMREGIAAVTGQPGMSLMTALVFLFNVARGFELVLLVLVAQDLLRLGSEGVGLLNAAIGVGALAAVPLIGQIAAIRRPAGAVVAALLLASVPLGMLASIDTPWVACMILLVAGLGIVVFEVLSIALVQRLSRLRLLGRVFGIQNSAINGGKLAGSLLAPLLVTWFSLNDALVVAALVVAVPVLVAIPGLRRIQQRTDARRRELLPTVTVLTRLALFDGVSEPALERVAAGLRTMTVRAGTRVLTEGAAPDDLYVVLDGEFAVSRARNRVAVLGADQWFGEIGLLRHTARTASVDALVDGTLWRIPGSEFLAAITEAAAPPSALLDDVSSRLGELDELDDPDRLG